MSFQRQPVGTSTKCHPGFILAGDRSSGFGSVRCDLGHMRATPSPAGWTDGIALNSQGIVRRFPFGSSHSEINPPGVAFPLRFSRTSQVASSFFNRHGVTLLRGGSSPSAPTACRLTVSCSISLPLRGSFHLSLTVLCAVGCPRI